MRMSRLTKGVLSILSGGTLAGLIGGLALGSFATGGHKAIDSETLMFADRVGNRNAAFGDTSVQGTIYTSYDISSGPPMEEIVCKGCGPGIAERMSASYAFGYDDRAVQAWLNYRPLPPMTTDALEAEVAQARPAPTMLEQPAPAAPSGPRPTVQPITPPAEFPFPSVAELAG